MPPRAKQLTAPSAECSMTKPRRPPFSCAHDSGSSWSTCPSPTQPGLGNPDSWVTQESLDQALPLPDQALLPNASTTAQTKPSSSTDATARKKKRAPPPAGARTSTEARSKPEKTKREGRKRAAAPEDHHGAASAARPTPGLEELTTRDLDRNRCTIGFLNAHGKDENPLFHSLYASRGASRCFGHLGHVSNRATWTGGRGLICDAHRKCASCGECRGTQATLCRIFDPCSDSFLPMVACQQCISGKIKSSYLKGRFGISMRHAFPSIIDYSIDSSLKAASLKDKA